MSQKKMYNINLFYFRKYLFGNVLIRDTFGISQKKQVQCGFNTDSGHPLTSANTIELKCQNFVRLYDTSVYHSDVYVGARAYTERTTKNSGVQRSRVRAPFINKFTTRGCKERSLKYFARALAVYVLIYRDALMAADLLLHERALLYLLFKRDLFRINGTHRMYLGLARDQIGQNVYFKVDRSPFVNIENTEFIFSQASLYAPIYTFDLNKVSKQVYKSTRGKAGKYVLKLKYLRHDKCFPYMFRYVKHS